MTREEAIIPFKMISSNWPFLKVGDTEIGFEVWYQAFQRYTLEEVTAGFQNAIENLTSTPNLAQIREYVETEYRKTVSAENDFNRKLRENANEAFHNAIRCKYCKDHGYFRVIYPTKIDAVRGCDCDAGHRLFGDKYFERVEQMKDVIDPLPIVHMRFGGEEEENAREEEKKYIPVWVQNKADGVMEIRFELRPKIGMKIEGEPEPEKKPEKKPERPSYTRIFAEKYGYQDLLKKIEAKEQEEREKEEEMNRRRMKLKGSKA